MTAAGAHHGQARSRPSWMTMRIQCKHRVLFPGLVGAWSGRSIVRSRHRVRKVAGYFALEGRGPVTLRIGRERVAAVVAANRIMPIISDLGIHGRGDSGAHADVHEIACPYEEQTARGGDRCIPLA